MPSRNWLSGSQQDNKAPCEAQVCLAIASLHLRHGRFLRAGVGDREALGHAGLQELAGAYQAFDDFSGYGGEQRD